MLQLCGLQHELVACSITYGTLLSLAFCSGTIWHTVLWFHNNCKQGGSHIQNVIAWPATFTGTTKEDFAHAGLLEGASREKSYANIFRLGGQPWAPLPHVSAAHQLFKKIVDTGTVSLFPLDPQLALRVRQSNEGILNISILQVTKHCSMVSI